jgi:hypothetical protein
MVEPRGKEERVTPPLERRGLQKGVSFSFIVI